MTEPSQEAEVPARLPQQEAIGHQHTWDTENGYQRCRFCDAHGPVDLPVPEGTVTTPDRHWRGMTLRDQLREWRERAQEAEARVRELEAELAQSQARCSAFGGTVTTADPKAEAYRLAGEAIASKIYAPAATHQHIARIVVDAVWDHLRHHGCRSCAAEVGVTTHEVGLCAVHARELEAELAQSQAEVKLRGEYVHDLFRELQAERRLLTEARDLLFHDDLHGKSDKPCPGCALEARIDAARSGAQGEEGDG